MGTAPAMETAAAALAGGDRETARTCFEAALQQEEESPEALFGLGTALWWLGETDAAVRAQERAYAAFRKRPDPSSAALAAMSVCLTYHASLGNYAASRGWVGPLARLVEQYDLLPMRAGSCCAVAVAANDTNDPETAEGFARDAIEVARRADDADLELCALSELGYAVVQSGRVAEGAAVLDEAMAGALAGEARQLQTVVFTECRSIVSCSRALEVERAVRWIRAAEPFARRYGSPHLDTTCRTHYGSLLFGQGKWNEAERELREALRIGSSAEPALYGEALTKVADELNVNRDTVKDGLDRCGLRQRKWTAGQRAGRPPRGRCWARVSWWRNIGSSASSAVEAGSDGASHRGGRQQAAMGDGTAVDRSSRPAKLRTEPAAHGL